MTTPTTSEASAPPEGSTSERLDHVEAAVDRIEQAVSRLLPGSHAEAEHRTEARLDRPSGTEEMTRMEIKRALEEQKKEEAAAAAKDAEKREGESVKERLARLEEKPPAPPRSRRTAMLGWGDGRG